MGIPMKITIKSVFVSSLLAVALATVPSLSAADSKSKAEDSAAEQSKPAAEQGKAKRNWYPFGGTVASVNKQANTISLKKKEGERVLKLDAKSELEIDGKPATVGSIKVGSYAHGKLHKDKAGNEVVMAAKFDKDAPKKQKGAADKDVKKAPASPPGK
jgi:hypothetical protein